MRGLFVGDCKLRKSQMKDADHFQNEKSRIIEKELAPLVEGASVTSMRLESRPALHTLRIGMGSSSGSRRGEIVLHMAKEALFAIEWLQHFGSAEVEAEDKLKKEHKVIAFRKRVSTDQRLYGVGPSIWHMNLYDLENGVPLGINADDFRHFSWGLIDRAFPTWYFDDWFQLRDDRPDLTRHLILRFDKGGLYGVGLNMNLGASTLGQVRDSDLVFFWDEDRYRFVVDQYYTDCGSGMDCYCDWREAKVKVIQKREQVPESEEEGPEDPDDEDNVGD